VEGLQSDNPDDSTKGGGKRTAEGWKPLEVGEFVLGYKDESGRVPAFPLPIELSRNGTYLVFRKLRKNVTEFQKFLDDTAKIIFGPKAPDNAADQLGALMMGRWQSGCPIDLSETRDNSAIGADPLRNNAFWSENDPKGERCPVGAHIRRTNPREEVDAPGALGSNRHRMIRRGLHYEKNMQDRGSVFIALNASISRQFEFLQRFWINNGEFLRLDRNERDPVIGGNRDERDLNKENGSHPETPRKFTMPGKRFPVAFDLPDFVTVRGGDYFFVPSLTALNGLAGGAFGSFLAEYKALETRVSDPGQLALARKNLLWSWLVGRPKEMFDELREKQPIFQMPGYEALRVWTVTIATKYADVKEILRKNNAHVFSVKKYEEKMKPPRGPFILGMPDGPEYQRELGILQAAVPQSDLDTIVVLVRKITDDIMGQLRPQGKLDLIQDLAWPVPLRLNGRYFGVSGPDEDTFKRWLRDIYTDLFLNLREDPVWTQKADVAVQQMNDYLNGLIDTLIASGEGGSNTVLARLVQMQRDPDPGKHLDKNGIRRNIFGITVGVVETNLKALARTVDQFLRRKDAYNAALQAIKDNDDTKLLQCIFEAMRFNPQNHVLFRWCEKTHVLAQGTTRATQIPANSLVFAATLSAMFDDINDGGKISDPEKFIPGRPDNNYLFFGYELHECFGRYISPILIREVIKRVLPLNNLRRAKNDQFKPLDLLPEHFMLEFDP
jgi:Dyp-type peroxidase family